MRFCQIMLGILALSLTALPSRAQHDVGNGGDPLMLIFTKAKADAVHILTVVGEAGAAADMPQDIRDFLFQSEPMAGKPRILALADDIGDSHHQWHDDDVFKNRCAATNIPPDHAVIHLSLPRCRATLLATAAGESEAVRLLIHEAAHHFGIGGSVADEDKANRIALTVYALWLRLRNLNVPHWSDTTLLDVPEARYRHTSVWTGDVADPTVAGRLILWGGCNFSKLPNREDCGRFLESGGRLKVERRGLDGQPPVTRWEPLDTATAPLGRILHTAIFTGEQAPPPVRNRMIIFGGCRGDDVACDQAFAVTACPGGNGADCGDPRKNNIIYDPAANLWSAAPAVSAPSPRVMHTAVWTGREMIVWGGLEGYWNSEIPDRPLADGGILRFSAGGDGVWDAIEAPPATTLTARYGHTSAWDGRKFYVWGGCERPGILSCTRYFNDGATFDPSTGVWEKLRPVPLEPRHEHSMVWQGRHLVIWGGRNGGGALSNGAVLDTVSGEWSSLPSQLPVGEAGRYGHAAVWDGLQGRMIVWGGQTAGDRFPQTTLILARDQTGAWRWSTAPTDIAPIGRKGHTADWVRDSMVLWGGFGDDDTFLYTGGILNP